MTFGLVNSMQKLYSLGMLTSVIGVYFIGKPGALKKRNDPLLYFLIELYFINAEWQFTKECKLRVNRLM